MPTLKKSDVLPENVPEKNYVKITLTLSAVVDADEFNLVDESSDSDLLTPATNAEEVEAVIRQAARLYSTLNDDDYLRALMEWDHLEIGWGDDHEWTIDIEDVDHE